MAIWRTTVSVWTHVLIHIDKYIYIYTYIYMYIDVFPYDVDNLRACMAYNVSAIQTVQGSEDCVDQVNQGTRT